MPTAALLLGGALLVLPEVPSTLGSRGPFGHAARRDKQNPPPPPAPDPGKPGAPKHACDHTYWGVKLGARRETTESEDGRSKTETAVISDLREDGFTVTTTASTGRVTNSRWACRPEGLVQLEPAEESDDDNVQLKTDDVRGVSLPANLAPGVDWVYAFKSSGSGRMPDGTPIKTRFAGAIHSKAVTTEQVSLAIGTFEALRIDSRAVFEMQIERDGDSGVVPSTAIGSEWWVKGLGLVRESATIEIGDEKHVVTSELVSAN